MIDNTITCSHYTLSDRRKQLVESHIGLVVSIAKRYRRPDISIQDLIQEGNMGLVHAAEKFDFSRGCAFSTYAAYWVQQTIERYLEDQKPFHIPTNKNKLIRKRHKFCECYFKQHGRYPTSAEIAEALDISLEKEKLLTELAMEGTSLDDPESWVDYESMDINNSLHTGEDDLLDDIDKRTFMNGLREALKSLDAMERRVLNLRYGIDSDEPLSLRKIGSKLNLSGEGVRLVEQRALKKLRSCLVEPAYAV